LRYPVPAEIQHKPHQAEIENYLYGQHQGNDVSHAEAPLGSYAPTRPGNPVFAAAVRKQELKKISRRILTHGYLNTKEEQHLLEQRVMPRLWHCGRTPISSNHDLPALSVKGTSGAVSLFRDPEGKSPGAVVGVQSCCQQWLCVDCAPKIARSKAAEISSGVQEWLDRSLNHSVIMLTYTFSHNRYQDLGFLWDGLLDARRKMKKQDSLKREPEHVPYKEIKRAFGICGEVAGIEPTYGDRSGWHPHTHDLLFLDCTLSDAELADLGELIAQAWVRAVSKRTKLLDEYDEETRAEKIRDMLKHSVKIQRGNNAADYISKFGIHEYMENKEILGSNWGLSQEMTHGHIKKGKRGGKTPWDMLETIRRNPGNRKVWGKFSALWREYARASYRKRQIVWSPGWKKELGLVVKERLPCDHEGLLEEILEKAEENEIKDLEFMGNIDGDVWKELIIKKDLDLNLKIMTMNHTFDQIEQWLAWLVSQPDKIPIKHR